MLNSLHPIRLLTRTDAEVNTLFHSFFLIEYLKNSDDIRVVERIPRERPKIDIIEQGLKLFIIESAAKSIHEELGGGFAVTTSDGSRFFAFYRCFDSRLFVAVSSIPSMQFSRSMFELLEFEEANTLLPTLLALTEIPIFPGPGLQYDIELAKGTASLKFSTAEQAEDADVDLMVLQLMSPMMMVKAWESIILERKVLVVSNVDSVIAPCCEFLRKMALPLVIVNTFVPLLPLLLINTVEAPFPYLLGANTTMLKENQVDLSDTVVIDLDMRSVTMPKNKSANSTCVASSNMVARIVQEINTIMLTPLGTWFNRPSSGYTGGRNQKNMYHPRQDEFYNSRATQILQVFVNANLSLVSARNCALRAFFRRPNCISDETYVELESIPVKKTLNNMGFDYRNGVYSGYMQLSKGITAGDDVLQHFVPTWSEMDAFVLSIYEFADDLPLIYIPNKDLESVSPCPVEPEGHVFEIVTKDQTVYRFTATDSESRRQWIQAIEEKMRIADAAANPPILEERRDKGPQSPLPSTRQDPSLSVDTSGMMDDGGGGDGGGSSAINQANSALGLPLPSIEEVESEAVVKEEANFRFFFMKTQMLTTLLHQVECDEFETVFKELDVKMTSLLGDPDAFEERVSKFLWKSGTVTALLQQIKDTADGTAEKKSVSGQKEKVSFHAHSSKQPLHKAASTNSMDTDTTVDTASINSFVSEKATTHRSSIALNPRPSSVNCSIVGGGSTASTGEKKKGFLGGLFHRNSTKDTTKAEEFEKYDELMREQEEQKLRDKAREDKVIQGIRAKVFVIISSYRRCQMELQKSIVENRLESIGNVMRRNLDNKPGVTLPPITYDIAKLIKGNSNASFYNGMNNLTLTNTSLNASNGVAGGDVHPSLHWYDHLWLSIVGKTWTAYKTENPEVSAASPVAPPPPTPPTVSVTEGADTPVFDSDDDDVPSRRQSRAESSAKKSADLSALQNAHQDSLRKDIREKLVTVLCEMVVKGSESNAPPFRPILQLLRGYVHETQGENEEAIQAYCEGQLVDYKRIMSCLVNEFLAKVGDKNEKFDELKFISWAYDVNPVLGLHAYRLIIEVLYREQLVKLNVDNFNMDKFLALGSFRTYPGSHWNTAKKDANGLLQRASANGATDFTWVENDTKSENMNESVICKSLNSNTSPCELSVQLLSRLREILRTYCQSPAGQKLCKKTPAGSLKLKISSGMIEELVTSSAFRAFEVNCCQLQKVDLSQLSNRQRVLFFCNVFNTITVHALILKGTPGNNLLERSAFMRSSKYNLGGLVYSLLDIEHGILRNASTKPMIFGPLTISISFADKDPRKAFALEDPWPNVSFCLFSACVSSPALVVLKDFNTVESEMKRATRKYFQEHVKIDPVQKSVELPGLMRIYWSDFGGNRSKVLKIISQMSGPQFAADMKPYLVDGVKPKVEFAQLDWTPMIIL